MTTTTTVAGVEVEETEGPAGTIWTWTNPRTGDLRQYQQHAKTLLYLYEQPGHNGEWFMVSCPPHDTGDRPPRDVAHELIARTATLSTSDLDAIHAAMLAGEPVTDEERAALAAYFAEDRGTDRGRCDANAHKGTGTGACNEPLDCFGQCARASAHIA